MRRIAAAKRAAASAQQQAPQPRKKASPVAPKSVLRPPTQTNTSWDQLGREVDKARRRNLLEQHESEVTDASGAVSPVHMKTFVELMRQRKATTSENRSMLLALGRTAQVAPERLEAFVQLGGLVVLGMWLKSAAPHADSSEQKAVAVGCIRIMGKLPVSHEMLQKSKIPSVVKEVAHKCPWAQKDVQTLLKHWCSTVFKEQKAPAPGLVRANQVVLESICDRPPSQPICDQPSPQNDAHQAPSPTSSSSSSSEEETEQGAAPGAASAAQEATPERSRFEPRKPEPPPDAKRRRVEDARLQDVVPQAEVEQDAEVQALLKELAQLNDLLLPD